MTNYIFLGPSLPVAEAAEILDAVYLPPIQQGDLLRLLPSRPRLVGIVDGYFETIPAVWHKEILLAMSKGVHVFGAASMGALRAAELSAFGMIGVGTIFEWYSKGFIIGDDEVAVLHAPEQLGYRALTDALVDIRDTCLSAVREGVIGSRLGDELVTTAQALSYKIRSYGAVFGQLRANGNDSAELADWLEYARTRGPALKSRDTRTLLESLRDFLRTDPPPKKLDFAVERTTFLTELSNEIAFELASGQSLWSCDDNTTVRSGYTLPSLRKQVLLRILARSFADQLGWKVTLDEVDDYADRFRAELGLSDIEAMREWMDTEGISEEMFWRFINDALLIERLEYLHSSEVAGGIADQLLLMTARQFLGK
jgi:hypothetical protein